MQLMSKRKTYQIKAFQKGQQSRRGVPELYDELKKPVSYGITQTAKQGINSQAESLAMSASEFIEKIGRGDFNVIASTSLALT